MYVAQKKDISINIEGNSIAICYGLEWLHSVMTLSAKSMVPFKFFTEPAKVENRSYPRSDNPGFFLFKDAQLNTASAAGGRQHVDFAHQVPQLCELFGVKHLDLKIPISDIAIVSKRAVCEETIRVFKGCKQFNVLGGKPYPFEDKLYPEWPVYGYPLLCVVGVGGAFTNEKANTQGEWRVVQCVFGAVLTRLLRERYLGIEVVSREGFGSVFPTLADIPDGIRLDPGLLPPQEGAIAIAEALSFINGFILEMKEIVKKAGLPKCVAKMNGYDSGPLMAVDFLMSELHSLAQSKPKAGPDAYAEIVARFTGKENECKLEYLDGEIKYLLKDAFPLIKKPKGLKLKRRAVLKEDSGYGSESDYEDEGEPEQSQSSQLTQKHDIALEKFKSKTDKDEKELSVSGTLAIKKISVLTGMAALRMATLYGMMYSKWLFTKTDLKATEEAKTSSIKTWAPYFELEHDFENLWKKVESNPQGIQVLLFDGAPNPINIPGHATETGSQPKKPSKTSKQKAVLNTPNNLGAIIIDTTNLASWEKAQYLFMFQKFLVQPKNLEQPGGVILMIDSASKHPTGGDLVHGVMRVCGHPNSVEAFFKQFLFLHLSSKMTEKLNLKEEQNTKTMTVLSEDETEARRMMKNYRLVMRNADFWQWF